MAAQIRIGIPGNSTSNFATADIPVLTLAKAPGGESLSSRSEIGMLLPADRSNAGTLAVNAPTHAIKYQWEFNAVLSEADSLVLGALIAWQKANPATGLRLIDEVEYLDPVPVQSRTLLATLNPTWNATYVYGYGVFSVVLIIGEGWRARFGRWKECYLAVAFGAEEG
jgi:hypothetical protein